MPEDKFINRFKMERLFSLVKANSAFMMNHKKSINPVRNRVYFTISKLSYAFLLLSGAMVVIGLLMVIYLRNFHNPILHNMIIHWELWLLWVFMNNLFFSMIIAGTVGIFISMPITIVLGIKLKSLRSAYLKEELGANKDFRPQKIPNLAQRSPRYIYYPY